MLDLVDPPYPDRPGTTPFVTARCPDCSETLGWDIDADKVGVSYNGWGRPTALFVDCLDCNPNVRVWLPVRMRLYFQG